MKIRYWTGKNDQFIWRELQKDSINKIDFLINKKEK